GFVVPAKTSDVNPMAGNGTDHRYDRSAPSNDSERILMDRVLWDNIAPTRRFNAVGGHSKAHALPKSDTTRSPRPPGALGAPRSPCRFATGFHQGGGRALLRDGARRVPDGWDARDR